MGSASRQRTAVVLRHVAGLSTAEAAEVLGCPTSTLTSHLRRGLAALRRSLDDDHGGDRP